MRLRLNLKTACINYNATLVHWHHTLGCQCSSFDTYAVHKVVPVRVFIAKKLNYLTTSLRGKNKVEVKFENRHAQLQCLPSSLTSHIGIVSAVVLVLMLFTKWGPSNNQKPYWRTDGRTDGQMDGRTDRQTEIINLIVGLVTRNPPKNGTPDWEMIAILFKNDCFHGNYGSLATYRYKINVFLDVPWTRICKAIDCK